MLVSVLTVVDKILSSPSMHSCVVFLDVIIDRGLASHESFVFVMIYCLVYPCRVFLLRRNHEFHTSVKYPQRSDALNTFYPMETSYSYNYTQYSYPMTDEHPIFKQLILLWTLISITAVANLHYHHLPLLPLRSSCSLCSD